MSDLPLEQLIPDFLAAVPLPALLVNQAERIIGANSEALTLLGQQSDGRHYTTVLRQPQVIEMIETCLRGRQPAQARHLSNDGAQDTTFEVTCRFVSGIGSVPGGAVLICFRDITDLERVGQMRRDFVANVSHELRTPLTAMMGFIETLQGAARDDPAARTRFLEIMSGEANRMNRLVGDLLSLNRVESEERVRPVEQVNLTEQINATLLALGPLAKRVGTQLIFNPPELSMMIVGDRDQLNQVLTNLIENAIKYGRKNGQVQVSLSSSERDPVLRTPGVRVQVSDDGPGIDPIHLPRLTERFYRADSHRSRELGGTGLGLAIVKHIINRHRGRLRVESELGQGSTFTVILPAAPTG
jgi:two-component system, OmpR family, phosphate regulon sensor histidine kinase PhoR